MRKVIHLNNLFNESIKLLSNCPVCRKQYVKANASLIDEVEDAHLLHVCCGNCSSSVLALIFTTGFGVTSLGLLTDLNSTDVRNFKEWQEISQDDVLGLYQHLQQDKLVIA